eukprot:CAMPEP_0183738948 /NCGR_PEP_ID=MMETSP0737-20130205/55850_1 /TAXON_ID=385413 /ORGANISM="Thalassiosira miniscula, Strain CCMP1093" /LENGTH=676 /DNA_ID=CAMNT_0025973607 /DNA_START=209 /DNA_END=2236 /DNA_ORIENTATION=-
MGTSTTLLADNFGGIPGFHHGVASGDPLPTSVILWTRYTPIHAAETIDVELRVAKVDEGVPFNDLLDKEKNVDLKIEALAVDNSTDFTLKIDMTGLLAGSNFVYAFVAKEFVSPVGQTGTAPESNVPVSEMTHALFSCAAYSQGYFHAYDIASTMKDVDLYIHVGDWIYEHGAYSSYADNSQERDAQLRPQWETVSLDDYRQRYALYAEDEAVQNLRRRAPLFVVWDDHEIADNSYGNVPESGAANHQEECPVNSTATNEEKNKEHCDFDEGAIGDRFNAAARAYMEWMPVRSSPGSMGLVDSKLGTLTRVLEWGNLATLVAFDTRISNRSKEPTLSKPLNDFLPVAIKHTNVTQYTEEGTPAREEIDQVSAEIMAKMYDSQFTMVGTEIVDMIKDKFSMSKENGKPWQIMLSPTMMGPNIVFNPADLWQYVPPDKRDALKAHIDGLMANPLAGIPLRISAAMSVNNVPWNRDDWNGFAHQRKQILSILKEYSNNPIILSGDLHDSWLWTIYEDGNVTGVPVAVNVGSPGVTAPGFGRSAMTFLGKLVDEDDVELGEDGLKAPLGGGKVGTDLSFDMVERAFEGANPGLAHAEVRHEGFVAGKITPTEHIAQYIHVGEGVALSNYSSARDANDGGLTAGYLCSGKFTTPADAPGVIEKDVVCDAIDFEMNDRPLEW